MSAVPDNSDSDEELELRSDTGESDEEDLVEIDEETESPDDQSSTTKNSAINKTTSIKHNKMTLNEPSTSKAYENWRKQSSENRKNKEIFTLEDLNLASVDRKIVLLQRIEKIEREFAPLLKPLTSMPLPWGCSTLCMKRLREHEAVFTNTNELINLMKAETQAWQKEEEKLLNENQELKRKLEKYEDKDRRNEGISSARSSASRSIQSHHSRSSYHRDRSRSSSRSREARRDREELKDLKRKYAKSNSEYLTQSTQSEALLKEKDEKIKEFENKFNESEAKRMESEKKRTTLLLKYSKMEEKIDQQNKDNGLLQKQLNESRQEFIKLATEHQKCAKFPPPMPLLDPRNEYQLKNIANIESENKGLKEKIDSLEAEKLQIIEAQKQVNMHFQQSKTGMQQKIIELQQNLDNKEEEVKKFQEKCKVNEAMLNRYVNAEAKYQNVINTLTKEKNDAEHRMEIIEKRLNDKEEENEGLKEAMEMLEAQKQELKNELAERKKQEGNEKKEKMKEEDKLEIKRVKREYKEKMAQLVEKNAKFDKEMAAFDKLVEKRIKQIDVKKQQLDNAIREVERKIPMFKRVKESPAVECQNCPALAQKLADAEKKVLKLYEDNKTMRNAFSLLRQPINDPFGRPDSSNSDIRPDNFNRQNNDNNTLGSGSSGTSSMERGNGEGGRKRTIKNEPQDPEYHKRREI